MVQDKGERTGREAARNSAEGGAEAPNRRFGHGTPSRGRPAKEFEGVRATARDFVPTGALLAILLPPTYGSHVTETTAFTVLSVEVWSSGLVVNVQLASDVAPEARIILQDHFGTEYALRKSVTLGSRNLQVFSPSLPAGTRSLTVKAAYDAEARPAVTFAVPLMSAPAEESSQRLRRPA